MFLKMRYIAMMTIFLLAASFSCKEPFNEKIAAKDNSLSVKWENISAVFKNRDNIKKPVLIFFYTEWCTFCKKMDRDIFSDDKISQYMNENFISIRVNPEKENDKIKVMEKDLTPYELMMHIGAQGFPTTLFLNEKTEPLTAIPGYIENKTFLLILKYLKEELYNKKISLDDYIKNSESR